MRFLPFLFAVTLFLSAFLSFSVQPILGKMLLPLVGGAPSAWVVTLAFFQLSLLAGYGVSALLGRVHAWAHAAVLLILYALGWFFLPVALDAGGITSPAGVMRALAGGVFVPFVALTATTSALVRLFAATRHTSAHDPHYLFVASNVGSFVGLFLFPFYLEPRVGVMLLTLYWHVVYGVALIAVMLCAFAAWHMRAMSGAGAYDAAPAPNRRTVFMWFANACIACSLSLGVTTLITTDIGGLPLLWVVPLGLYLVTFILAFARRQFISAATLNFMHVAAVMIMVLIVGVGRGYQPGGPWAQYAVLLGALLLVFFVTAWACHRRVADTRPAPRYAAFYYFILALGGATAGVVHAFVLPFVLPDVVEFTWVMLGSLLLNPLFYTAHHAPNLTKHKNLFLALAVAACGVVVAAWFAKHAGQSAHIVNMMLCAFTLCTLILTALPRHILLVGCVAFFAAYPMRYAGDVVERGRNFFGAYAVFDLEKMGHTLRYFTHGNTVHGLAITDPSKPDQSYHIGYYARENPIRDALNASGAKTMGVVGLGAGQLACFDRDVAVDFYEIDPDVVTLARDHFPYLEQCPVRDIVMGDGRLSLAASDKTYDTLLLDAFTSDGVPAHLLTREAVQTYRAHLAADGVILFHISNRYVNLASVLAAVAAAENIYPLIKVHAPKGADSLFQFPSVWVALTPRTDTAGKLVGAGWRRIVSKTEPWTDDRFSILSAIMF